MNGLAQDLRYGIRMLGKTPGFTLVAVLTLALGIGANTTIFSWINEIILHPIAGVSDSDRLVVFTPTTADGGDLSLSYPDYLEFKDRARSLAGLTAYDLQAMNFGGQERPERVWGMIVSGNYFDVLGVKALIGRTFLPDEDKVPGAEAVVVVSHSLWLRRFGGDPRVVGTSITLNNQPFTLIGVTPPEFHGNYVGLDLEAWVPLMMQERMVQGAGLLQARGNHWLDSMARLAPGVTREQAQAEARSVAEQIGREFPQTARGMGVALSTLSRTEAGRILGPVLFVLLGVVAVVLLIACANVANLLLARATARARETTIRAALGAGRGRLIRQLLTESVILSLLGGAAGWIMALWTSGLLSALVPPTGLPVGLKIHLDWSVFAFTLIVSTLTGILFGLAPALQATRIELAGALKDEAGALAGGRRKSPLRGSLVVAQVALSLVLLICAGLFVRSLSQARSFDPGFTREGVLLASLDLFPNGYDATRGPIFLSQVLERTRALPGVESVSLARKVPLGFQGTSSTSFTIEGRQPAPDDSPQAFYNNIGPDYFATLKVPLLRGREFTAADDGDALTVAVINEALEQRFWPEGDALGKRIGIFGKWATVVGVTRTIKHKSLDERLAPYVYLPVLQFYRTDTTLHVRASTDPLSLAAALTQEIQKLDPELPVFGVRTLEASTYAAMIPQRIGGMLLGAFGLLALLMAAVGLYAMLAFSVSQRTREIGIRRALGARSADILLMTIRQGMRLTLMGALLGLTVSFGVARLLSSFLIGVSSADPLTFTAVPLLLGAVALLGCYIPARRATCVDPTTALRYE